MEVLEALNQNVSVLAAYRSPTDENTVGACRRDSCHMSCGPLPEHWFGLRARCGICWPSLEMQPNCRCALGSWSMQSLVCHQEQLPASLQALINYVKIHSHIPAIVALAAK